jgi:hypothetical protein
VRQLAGKTAALLNLHETDSAAAELPAIAAASITELPAGTEISTPSTVRVTFGPSRGGSSRTTQLLRIEVVLDRRE